MQSGRWPRGAASAEGVELQAQGSSSRATHGAHQMQRKRCASTEVGHATDQE